jgi:hypothetical protein
MAKAFVCLNFYGHGDPAVAGLPATAAPFGAFFRSQGRIIRRGATLRAVSASRIGCPQVAGKKLAVFDYNAALGEEANKSLPAKLITGEIAKCSDEDQLFYMITGFSSGGVTAIHVAAHLARIGAKVVYVGLSDSAFQRNESDYLMLNSGVRADYMKNDFQTLENDPKNPEIHDAVAGFTNFNLDDRMDQGSDLHQQAVIIGNDRMCDDVVWCYKNV